MSIRTILRGVPGATQALQTCFTAAMRAARTKPTVYFWYTDGGIIQGITVNSVEVQ